MAISWDDAERRSKEHRELPGQLAIADPGPVPGELVVIPADASAAEAAQLRTEAISSISGRYDKLIAMAFSTYKQASDRAWHACEAAIRQASLAMDQELRDLHA